MKSRPHIGKTHIKRDRRRRYPLRQIITLVAIAGLVTVVGVIALRHSPSEAVKPLKTENKSKKIRDVSKPKQQQKSETSLAIDERRTVNGKIIKIPKNPFGTPIPKDLEYKPIWEYTPEDYARVDPGYAARHEKFLAAQAANPWKTPSDRNLSMLLFAKNGNMGLLIPFDASFKDKFLKSLETPIIIDPEQDSPELQAQKREMIQARNYLKEQYDAGEDIIEILNETYRYQKRMADLRDNLERELRALEKTANSVAEVQDYIDAANIMLEREGAGRIGLPLALTRYRLSRKAETKGNNND